MFNFLVMMKEGETVALLTDGGYNVTFMNSEAAPASGARYR